MKKVSLILTTYNCKENLIKTLKSIEKQDYPNIEVCICDSCSTDGTLDVIKEYASIPSREGLLTMVAGGMMQYVRDLSIGLNLYAEQLENN